MDTSFIPVTLVVGFLEAGKTTYINSLIHQYSNKQKVLLIQCEEGEIDYSDLPDNFSKEFIEYSEDFNRSDITELVKKHDFNEVIIELNGMWQLQYVESSLPRGWKIEQMHTIIDGSTFEQYSKMMGQLMNEKIRFATKIYFNRCNDQIALTLRKKNIRLLNTTKEIFLVYPDHTENYDDGNLRPIAFRCNDVVVSDEDFGYWFADFASDNNFYLNKTLTVNGIVFKNDQLAQNEFVVGRSAMVCCGNDMVFLGLMCKGEIEVSNNSYIQVTGLLIKAEENPLHIPAYLIVKKVQELPTPNDPIVRF